MRLMTAKGLTGTIAVPAEGSVLPDSYSFQRGDTRRRMLDADAERDDALSRHRLGEAQAADLARDNAREALILASIVEKETGKPERARDGRGGLFEPAEARHDAPGRSDDHLPDHQGPPARPPHPAVRGARR